MPVRCDLHEVDDAVTLIYLALDDSGCWRTFLGLVKERLRLTMLSLVVAYPHQRSQSFTVHEGLGSEDLQEYLGKWADKDPWRLRWLASPAAPGTLVSSQELISDEALMADPCWQNFLSSRKMHYAFGARLAQGKSQIASIEGVRATNFGPLIPAEKKWLEKLFPHLVRVVSVHGKIARLRAERDALFTYFESLATGVIMVNAEGTIRLANTPAEAVFSKGTELARRNERLVAIDPRCNRELEALILQACSSPTDESRQAGMLAIHGTQGRPLVVQVTPANGKGGDATAPGGPNAMVWIIDPAGPDCFDPTPLQAIFRLTPSEARLCKELVHGKSVKEVASQWNVAVPTVRTHLAHALEKTATRRQSELIMLTLRIACIPHVRKLLDEIIHSDDAASEGDHVK